MTPVMYAAPADANAALAELDSGLARFLAGGTNLIDLMKENLVRPAKLVETLCAHRIHRRAHVLPPAGGQRLMSQPGRRGPPFLLATHFAML